MKKKKIIITIIMIILVILLIPGGFFLYKQQHTKKYIGIWESQDDKQIIKIFKDGTVFLYQNSITDDDKIILAKIGKLDKENVLFSEKYDGSGCLTLFTSVTDIPKDDYLPITEVYHLDFQGTDIFLLLNATDDSLQKLLFQRTSNKIEKSHTRSEEEASDYQMTAIIDDNFSEENLKSQIEKLNGVSSVTYISPKEAWNEFQKEYFENSSEDAEGFKDDNPLAGSGYFEIKYKIKYKSELLSEIQKMDGIRQINYSSSF